MPGQALPATRDDGTLNAGTVSFVCSFVIIVNWTLLQVHCRQLFSMPVAM